MKSRQLIGLQNKQAGASFETLIEQGCTYYREKQVAVIDKTPEPLRVIRNNKNGTMTAVFTKKAQPDFKGVLVGGKAVIFEAKQTSKDRIRQSSVTDVQVEYLNDYAEMGALCYILVCIQFEHYFRVPWDVFFHMKENFGHKYMSVEELEPYRIQYKKNVLLFLEGVQYQA